MKHKHMKTAQKGFTLIELLIVIAVLAILVVVVIAAINPIETINKSRDTQEKADISQILDAADRFYVENTYYPWVTAAADDPTIALTDITTSWTDGTDSVLGKMDGTVAGFTPLVKESFTKRFDTYTTPIQIYMASDTSTVYACFTPLSESVTQEAVTRCADAPSDYPAVCTAGSEMYCLP